MLSSSTTNDLTYSINSNHKKSTYDNLSNSMHYPSDKNSDPYDNYPMKSDQQQSSLGNYSL
jgi:hypothetical protein